MGTTVRMRGNRAMWWVSARVGVLAIASTLVGAALLAGAPSATAAPVPARHTCVPGTHHLDRQHPIRRVSGADFRLPEARGAQVSFRSIGAGPVAADAPGQDGGLLGAILGQLVSTVGNVGAAVTGVLDSATDLVLRPARGIAPTGPVPAAPSPTRIPAPTVQSVPVAAAPPPAAVLAPPNAPPNAPAPPPVAIAPVPPQPAPGSTTAAAPSPTPAGNPPAAIDLPKNPVSLLGSPGTAILILVVLAFTGAVLVVVFGAGYRGRRGH